MSVVMLSPSKHVRKGPTQFISKGIPCDCLVAAIAQPMFAPRNDMFFYSRYNSVGLWVSSQQPRVKIKQKRAGQCDKGIKDLSIAG